MSIRLDDLELVKRIQDGLDSPLTDLRSIYGINIVSKRNVVELEIPGSIGNTLQDMGCEPINISLVGEIMGHSSRQSLEKLIAKFNTNKPFQFSSDITSISEINQVMIHEFYFEEVAGTIEKYRYHMVLREYEEPREQSSEEVPPSQEERAKQDVEAA